jgi:aminoglycoside phosphotransferase (APT) family kinase protein
MKANESIHGILNHKQLEFFCEKFNIEPSELKANFDGWRKLVLYTDDKVFLFPRNPRVVFWLDIETVTYELFNKYPKLPVPRLIDKVTDDKISYYDFTVASRLKGISYSKLEDEVTYEEVSIMLCNLTSTFVLWHEIPVHVLPEKIKQRTTLYDEEKYKWEIQLLNPETMHEAIDHVFEIVVQNAEKYSTERLELLNSSNTKRIWIECLEEIVNLPHVLIHSDIHEDQILVDSKEDMQITGILDWETAMFGHPIWEFNFLEWGFGIWKWWDNFSDFRREMWRIYSEGRSIKLQSLEGLDLFYTLSEFLIVLKPNASLRTLIGQTFESSLIKCLEKLSTITSELQKK